MQNFIELLINDYDSYILNVQYVNWGIFGLGFCSLFIGWYFIMGHVLKEISTSFGKLKNILKIFPLELINGNRYITSYLDKFKT